jgi:hypothetical protein
LPGALSIRSEISGLRGVVRRTAVLDPPWQASRSHRDPFEIFIGGCASGKREVGPPLQAERDPRCERALRESLLRDVLARST